MICILFSDKWHLWNKSRRNIGTVKGYVTTLYAGNYLDVKIINHRALQRRLPTIGCLREHSGPTKRGKNYYLSRNIWINRLNYSHFIAQNDTAAWTQKKLFGDSGLTQAELVTTDCISTLDEFNSQCIHLWNRLPSKRHHLFMLIYSYVSSTVKVLSKQLYNAHLTKLKFHLFQSSLQINWWRKSIVIKPVRTTVCSSEEPILTLTYVAIIQRLSKLTCSMP